jgi:Protein of unknown function (DUF4239)
MPISSDTLVASVIIIATTLAAIAGLWIVRKKVSFDVLLEHHEVANPMVTIVSTLYSVLLGFLVVCAFNKFDSCRLGVQAEANSVGNVFYLAAGLPDAAKSKIQTGCLSYVHSVIDDEFPAMIKGGASEATEQKLEKLWTDVQSFSPATSQNLTLYDQLLTSVKSIFDRRQNRIFELSVGMWPVLWTVLIFGNAIIIVFTYFFAMKHLSSQMIMVGLLHAVNQCLLGHRFQLPIRRTMFGLAFADVTAVANNGETNCARAAEIDRNFEIKLFCNAKTSG